MKKQGVELTLSTIIIAIIVLLVLVLLAYLLLKGGQGFSTGTACFQAGGTCKDSNTCTLQDGRAITDDKGANYKCSGNEVCCKLNTIT